MILPFFEYLSIFGSKTYNKDSQQKNPINVGIFYFMIKYFL